MYLNTPYYVSSVSSANTASPTQTLTPFAQWVYYEFRLGDINSGITSQYVPGHATGLDTGTLTVPLAYTVNSIKYTADANDFAGAIQEAIWSGLNPAYNLFANPNNPVDTRFSDATIAAIIDTWYTDFSNDKGTQDYVNFQETSTNILIAQLTDPNSNAPAQNQMVLGIETDPAGSTSLVPEPTTLVVWSLLSLGGVGTMVARRRRAPDAGRVRTAGQFGELSAASGLRLAGENDRSPKRKRERNRFSCSRRGLRWLWQKRLIFNREQYKSAHSAELRGEIPGHRP